MAKKFNLTDGQKNILTYIALGGVGYLIYLAVKNKSKVTDKAFDQWLKDNNIPKQTANRVDEFASLICDPNLFVYPSEVAVLIETMDDKQLSDFNLIYETFYRGNLCEDYSLRDLLDAEWGNYYQNTQEFLREAGY